MNGSILQGILLFLSWIILSGHFEPFLLGLGAVGTVAVVLISRRMEKMDRVYHPIHLRWKIIFYWFWLLVRIVQANIRIAWIIVQRKMPISPTVVRVQAHQKTTVGKVTFANSITLTPGTVTIAIKDDMLDVHALTREDAAGILHSRRDSRITGVEDLDGARDDAGLPPAKKRPRWVLGVHDIHEGEI